MNDWAAPPGADRVPTLTEVVVLAPPVLVEAQAGAGTEMASPARPEPEPASAAATDGDAGAEGPPDSGGATDLAAEAGEAAAAADADGTLPTGAEGVPAAGLVTELAPPVDLQALVALSLAELQPRLDMLLESRLREALAPALARAAEGLIGDARAELATALNELVQDAVRRALQRQSSRAPSTDMGPPHRP